MSSNSERSPNKRSQNVTIPRESLIETREQVAQAWDNLEYARLTEIMLRTLKTYLDGQDTDEAYQANLFLSYWLDTIPEALSETQKLLDKAHVKLERFSALEVEGEG